MIWLFVGFLVGLATHRGYLKIVSWRRKRRFEKASHGLAIDIAEAQMEELHDAAHRNYRRNYCFDRRA